MARSLIILIGLLIFLSGCSNKVIPTSPNSSPPITRKAAYKVIYTNYVEYYDRPPDSVRTEFIYFPDSLLMVVDQSGQAWLAKGKEQKGITVYHSYNDIPVLLRNDRDFVYLFCPIMAAKFHIYYGKEALSNGTVVEWGVKPDSIH